MTPQQQMALLLNPALILRAMDIEPDPWQQELLLSQDQHILLLSTRGAGKSRTVSALAVHEALCHPRSLTLIVSKAQRQAGEIFRYCKQAYQALERPVEAVKETETQLEFANGSRIVTLPGKEETIRCYQGVNLLILDEAARVPDDVYRTVRPMIGISHGRLVALTTPYGQRGWFWKEWTSDETWKRFEVPWQKCPRYDVDYINRERRSMGDSWVAQEYECQFTALEGLVYPNFHKSYTDFWTLDQAGQLVGGIDWGWRNPFAAIWGVLDRDGVLWLQGERYERQCPLHEHAKHLPHNVTWYADPAGASEIALLRAAGYVIRKANNNIRAGIAAVTGRIESSTLRVNNLGCPNLCAEAKLYRYPSKQEKETLGENPVDEHNHALAALRYLVSRIDARLFGRIQRQQTAEGDKAEDLPPPPPQPKPKEITHLSDDDRMWTRI